jgi:L-lactate dehydrogenase complex protein LldE
VRVALFIPCFIDQFYPDVGKAMVAVLRRVGVDPVFPAEQTCCGQPAFNTGYWDEARRLAQRYCDIFADADAIVSPSGSCTAMVRNYYPELLGQTPHAAAHTYELAEFLVRHLKVTDVGAKFPATVTYHDGCHARRELGLKDEPRQLLAKVRDLQLIELDEPETCCGFGGTFSVKFPPISSAMGDLKAASVRRTGAQYVVSSDSSCLMQIGGCLTRQQLPVQTLHLAEVLART